MTTLRIPNDVLRQAGLTEQEAVLELACRLFQTGRLGLFQAAQLAGLPQAEFEDFLLEHGIPLYAYSENDLRDDLSTLGQPGQ